MDDFKKRLLLMKNKTKEERKKNGSEYMPYQKYYEENNNEENEEEEHEIILLNKNKFDSSEDEKDKNEEEQSKDNQKKKKLNINEESDNNNSEQELSEKDEEKKGNKIISLREEEEEDKDENNKNKKKTSESDTVKKKKKYKITIKPSYITIEKKDNAKIRVVDSTQFSNEYKSNELYNWINLVLEDWEQYILENLNNKRIKSNIVSKELEKYKQCSQNIKPLLALLQERQLNQVILDKLFKVMVFAENRDLLNANDRYIDLSIGNAAWPMGLTMVGIHQRTGKSSVAPTQVAYILNDEVTKKYLQSIRRILSFLQIRYNIAPSQSVYN